MTTEVIVGENAVKVTQKTLTGAGHINTDIYLNVTEAERIGTELLKVREKMAKNKRVAAQRLLTEAEQLDPEGK